MLDEDGVLAIPDFLELAAFKEVLSELAGVEEEPWCRQYVNKGVVWSTGQISCESPA